MPDPVQINGSCSIVIKASTQLYASYKNTAGGIAGEFGIIGQGALSTVRRLWASRSRTKYAILGPSSSTAVTGTNLFGLDLVKDGQPFVWAATRPPSLLTLDWVNDAQPFVSNDSNAAFAPEIIFSIQANTSLAPTVAIGFIQFVGTEVFRITATDSFIGGSSRFPKPCELPGSILELTSNLPYGVWQTNPLAIFTWTLVYMCDRFSDAVIPVQGYLYYLDHNPNQAVDRGGTFTRIPEVQFDLAADPTLGTGSWWFHVAAFNGADVGPTTSYNVKYDNIPTTPGFQYMRIDNIDTLLQQPLVAYTPVSPHQLTWNISTDLDPSDIVSYELQIGRRPDFTLNPDSGVSEIVLDVQSVMSNVYVLTNPLEPDVYFWRLRAFDGSEYSEWGPTGSFRVNHPPLAPYDLSVIVTG